MINHDSWTLDSIVEAYKHDQPRGFGKPIERPLRTMNAHKHQRPPSHVIMVNHPPNTLATGSLNILSLLKAINKQLWEIEDRIRVKESTGSFDGEFIELARSVYLTTSGRESRGR